MRRRKPIQRGIRRPAWLAACFQSLGEITAGHAPKAIRPSFETLEVRQLLAADLVISEFMASNDDILLDQDGEASDWIEIHNPTGAAVNLAGWSLTDNPADLRKWTFPDVQLAAGAYLVVFASNKNRAVAGNQLHTNFALSASGEYLALVKPDGSTIASQYAPQFPAQLTDISYGVSPEATVLLPTGAEANFHVPASDVLGTTWTAVEFETAGWTTGPTGIGFDTSAATPEPIAYWSFDNSTSDLSGNGRSINLVGAKFSSDVPAAIGGGASLEFDGVSQYAVASLDVSETEYTVSLWFKTTSSGRGIYSVTNGDLGAGGHDRHIYLDGTNAAARVYNDERIRTTGRNYADGKWHHLVHVYKQGTLGQRIYVDGVQVAAGAKQFSDFNWQTHIHLGFSIDAAIDYFKGQIDDVAIWNSAFTSSQVASLFQGDHPLSLSYSELIETDVRAVMQNKNASIYLRIPFEVADPSSFDSLALRMKYDDGFVAYLNGTEVARRNAPASVQWNSRASSERHERAALVYEEIDLSAFHGSLQPGANVLAIHGLNFLASNSDLLLLPELVSFRSEVLTEHFYARPSPGAANSSDFYAKVADTKFSHSRGFYDAAFNLTISTSTSGAVIRYTLDGSPPTATSGTIYTGPIAISGTTTLRAAAFKAGFEPTNIDTQTYIFLDNVLAQPNNPAGFPTTWGVDPNNANRPVAADYAMDQNIVNNSSYSSTIRDDLRSIPTLSIVMKTEDMFGPNGIYSNPLQEGPAWERPASVEWINPDGTTVFQANSGIQLQGGYSRRPDATPKHSFRLVFKAIFGDTKLRYPLFGPDAADEFDTLYLRANFNDSWLVNIAQFTRDQWAKDVQLAMGDVSPHGNFVHLYINGLYWGLYNPTERPGTDFQAHYFGGTKEEYDILHTFEVVDGDRTAWNQMMAIAQAGLSSNSQYQAIQQYLDIPNLINYCILNIYGGNWDWPHNNWFAARRRVPGGQFRFFSHDAEGSLYNDLNADRSDVNAADSPGYLYAQLRANAEFRLLFADHLQKHFFNGGPLSPQGATELFLARASEIDRAVVGESARWGDVRRSPAYNRDVDWIGQQNWLVTQYFPQRTNIVLNQFRSDGLFPSINAPLFSQRGGRLTAGQTVTLTGTGTIYYTTDGSDPRLPGGAISASAKVYNGPLSISETTYLRVRARSGAVWSAIDEATFAVDASAFRITEIMYNPAPPAGGIPYQTDDFQYIELQNTGSTSLDIEGVRFTEGINFTFPDTKIAPGARVIVAKNPEAFASRYGPGITPIGTFTGSLDNGGERLRLEDAIGSTILDFEYNDSWYSITDGDGFSLVTIDPSGQPEGWDSQQNWRPSQFIHGNPGTPDNGVNPGSVVINELLSHTSQAQGDWVELRNTTASPIDIGGWFLSDSSNELTKFRIPFGTIIPAGGYLVFNERDHFGNLANSGTFTAFEFSEGGGAAYLSSGSASGTLAGYRDDKSFSAAEPEVAFARHIKSTGGSDFVPASNATPGSANAYPQVGPIVFNEIMYHPPAGSDEYLELVNISAADVPLFDPAHPENTWQFTAGITFSFPTAATVPAGGYALVVPIAPAAFRSKYNIPANVQIFGPYTGALDNAGETLRLSKPGMPSNGVVPYLAVDHVKYDDTAPWPILADGAGSSLCRFVLSDYANDVGNWRLHTPGGSPGAVNDILDSLPPTVPGNIAATLHNSGRATVDWTASVDAETGVAQYRVYRNGALLATTTELTYIDASLAPGNSYVYQVSAVNGHGFESELSAAAPALAVVGITSLTDTSSTRLVLTFSEPVTLASAQTTANYSLSGGVVIQAAVLGLDGRTVTLTTASSLVIGTTYRLVVKNLATVSGAPMTEPVQGHFTAGPGSGLKGEYFNNSDFTDLALTRTDATVNFTWLNNSPDPALQADSFSVRWTGQVKALTSDTYTFYTVSDEGVRLWINDRLIIDNWNSHPTTENSGTIALVAGQKYDLRLEYFDATGHAQIQLYWSAATLPKQIVPVGQLYPLPQVGIRDIAVPEGSTGTTQVDITISLSAPSSQPVVVAYRTIDGTATAGSDYPAQSGLVTFAPGTTSQVITLTTYADTEIEPSETLLVQLTSPSGHGLSDNQAVVTLHNDDLPTLTIDDVSTAEQADGMLAAVFTLTLSSSADQVTVQYSTADQSATAGSDYTAQSGTVTFAIGSSTRTISIPIIDDPTFEADEAFLVNLFNPVGAALARTQAVGTIVDNDAAPSLSIEDLAIVEKDNGSLFNAIFTVSLASPSSQLVTVAYSTTAGTATAIVDYLSRTGNLTFNPGVVSMSILVPIKGDNLSEADETYFVSLSNPVGATITRGTAVGTIIDNDPLPALSIADITLVEGTGGTTSAVFTLNLSAASGQEVAVAYATADGTAAAGSDYQAQAGTATFAAGATSQTITIPVVADRFREDNESFFLNLSSPAGAVLSDNQAVATITNDDDDVIELPIVTNTGDSGVGSLRSAIENANAGESPTITFEIPGGGPHVIQLASPLPALTQSTVFHVADGQTIEIGTASDFSLAGYSSLIKAGAGTLVLGGNQSQAAAANLTANEGTLNVLSDLGSGVSLVVNAQVNFAAGQRLAGLTIGDGGTAAVAMGGGKVLAINNFSIDGAGRLDLGDNDLVVYATPETRDAALAQVTAAVMAGANGLAWNGPGISSSAAAADPALLTALGVMLNDDGLGNAFHTSFSGHTVDANSILVKFTYYGDADLTGSVDGTDYALIDNGNNSGLSGWFNGDFSYDSLVDGTDYALIDNAFNAQGSPLSAPLLVAPATTQPLLDRVTNDRSSHRPSSLDSPEAVFDEHWAEALAPVVSPLESTEEPSEVDFVDSLDEEILELLLQSKD